MKKLSIIATIVIVALCIASCKNNKEEEINEVTVKAQEQVDKVIAAENAIAEILNNATEDNIITSDEATSINDAILERRYIESEVKQAIADDDEVLNEYFRLMKESKSNLDEAYNNALSVEGFELLSSSVK